MPMVIGLPTLQPSSNSVSRGRFGAQFLRAGGERFSTGGGGAWVLARELDCGVKTGGVLEIPPTTHTDITVIVHIRRTWGGPRHPGCPRGTYISITMGVPQKYFLVQISQVFSYLCRPGKSRSR